MRKKKYPFRKKEQAIPYAGIAYSSRFIYYNDQGVVEMVAPCKENVPFNCLVIEDSLIPDFIEGKRLYKDYSISYFQSLKNGIEIDDERVVKTSKIGFYIIPLASNYENEITIEHYSDRWKINTSSELIDDEVIVYVALKTNISFLVRQLRFTKDNGYTELFQSDNEKSLRKLSLITKAKHHSYAVKELHE